MTIIHDGNVVLTIIPTLTFESSLHDSNYDAPSCAYPLSRSSMEVDTLRLGFIGFGEAASRFAQDLSQAGLQDIVAYSPSAAKAGPDDAIRRKADDARVELLKTPKAGSCATKPDTCTPAVVEHIGLDPSER